MTARSLLELPAGKPVRRTGAGSVCAYFWLRGSAVSSFFNHYLLKPLTAIALAVFLCGQSWADGQTAPLPKPVADEPLATTSSQRSAVFAGGCFWGVQEVFQHVKGVISATSGYAGGQANTARYDHVSTGTTGHSESVAVIYDPAKITYGQLLQIFFGAAHNPTQMNRQGSDIGTQYKSRIFAANGEQKQVAEGYIAQLSAAKTYPKKIVTEVLMLPAFYPAEDYHQNHAKRFPAPYILDKVERLKVQVPELYK